LRADGREGADSVKEFDEKSLAEGDGKEGRPALVAHGGRVVDVTGSKRWPAGLHMRRHAAGRDLTADLAAAPHGAEVLDRFPQVGTFAAASSADEGAPLPEVLERLLDRFPKLRRHPHPMTVHFPIAFGLAAVVFSLLHLLTGVSAFETTAFHCLGAGAVTTPMAMLTGFAAWKINYLGRPLRPVRLKIRFSALLAGVFVAAFAWRLAAPAMSAGVRGPGAAYLLLVLSLVPLVSVLGSLGASLTFPAEQG
jgi:predicted heme/steroid binding protein/uncharacterized membrane protein